MRKHLAIFLQVAFLCLFILLTTMGLGQTPSTQQTLKLKDFAIWGGSSAAQTYNTTQGVILGRNVTVQGNMGSNHRVNASNSLILTGNIYSGNTVALLNDSRITGNVVAAKSASNINGNVLTAGNSIVFTGNLTANGRMVLNNTGTPRTTVSGQIAIPALTANNYSGPTPAGGITNVYLLPVLPLMPNNTPFDNQSSTRDVTITERIAPGVYRNLTLSGNRTITFDGPGDYIFNEVNNGNSTNKLVFDFKGRATGMINIFIKSDAKWGRITVSTANGSFPSRIYTEVHGSGATDGGVSFRMLNPGVLTGNNYAWLGNVWAPSGGIAMENMETSSRPHIIGALWSGTNVTVANNLRLSYEAPAAEPNFIVPYYLPPLNGKVHLDSNRIGAELLALLNITTPIDPTKVSDIFRLDGRDSVWIEVISKIPNDATLKADLKTKGMGTTVDNGPHSYIITGKFFIDNIPLLNNISRIEYVRPLYPPITNGGAVTTQGDNTMRSNFVRERFGLDGTGVKVGVISDSYNSIANGEDANNDIAQGDLPNDVQILPEYPIAGKDEGRAMLQIVHDIAPNAKLAFVTGFLSAGNFARGILALANPTLAGGRCDVIVDDITYITEPFLRDGIVAQAVDTVVSKGVTYFSSAGNFGSRSHEAQFIGVSNNTIVPSPATIHRFGALPTEIYQSVTLKPGSYTIVLQWSDQFHSLGDSGDLSDLDLYILGANGYRLFGFNRSNLSGDPYEVCPFTVTEETAAQIMIVNARGTSNVRFKYMIFRGDATILNYQVGIPTSTIVGHPNAKGAIAVGAMLYDKILPYTPIWPGVASFSSRGGTNVLENGRYAPRNKPELIAPNGVNTTVNLGGPVFDDGDDFYNFFGTSASAPHVAAVAALLIQGQKKYNLKEVVTPAEIREQLQTSTGSFLGTFDGFSYVNGYGYVQADSAIQQIANARPILTSLEAVVPGAQNGTSRFMVRLRGKYLTSSTEILVNGVTVPTTVSSDRTEATALVNDIPEGQDPPFQLRNAPISPSELDGGLSEALYFFSSKTVVEVRALDTSRKYGQNNPEFKAEVLINGIPINQTKISLATLKLDGANLVFNTIATSSSKTFLYTVTPARAVPLAENDPLLATYSFRFIPGTMRVGKMALKITPNSKKIKYGEFPDITFNYEVEQSSANDTTLLEKVALLHKKFLSDNSLVVINNNFLSAGISSEDLDNMGMIASFQAIRNARKFIIENGQLQPLNSTIAPSQIGNQRFLVDVGSQSILSYKQNLITTYLNEPIAGMHARGLLNIKSLVNGTARAAVPNGQLQPMVNGQLMAMVNGQLQALVNGQLKAMVNGVETAVEDLVFQNGQLVALVNGSWLAVPNGQLQALVNGISVTVNLSVTNGQLQAIVNGQLMTLVNGQLQAIVNGQLLALVNGQLQAMVNGQLMPLVNGQLMAMVNGQLQALVNGQLLAMVNGQLMALVNGELQIIQDISLSNGQLQALVNGQLQALVNGQLKAMVNGTVTDIPTDGLVLANGQLQALVNGQLQALVNGQLQALVNGQLQPLVNGAGIAIESVRQLTNGQLQALVNGAYIPITNGQLQALVNGQLLAMVNGQLMAMVNGQLTFAVLQNGQLQALVNGQLQALVNGQLMAMGNGQLQALVNVEPSSTLTNNTYKIVNGQLQALVNGQDWSYTNGQLLAMVNGQLQALVNNFDVSGATNNTNTAVLIDEDDITLQSGGIGGMFAINMITGLNVGKQTLIPGAFINENFEVTYGQGEIEIVPALLVAKANDITKVYGEAISNYSVTLTGFVYGEGVRSVTSPIASSAAATYTVVGQYPINVGGGSAINYSYFYQPGTLTIQKKLLKVTADNKERVVGAANPPLTISYDGFVGADNEKNACLPFLTPASPKVIEQLERSTTYSNVKINGTSNVYHAKSGEIINLTGAWSQVFINPGNPYCPGCITQLYIGMANENGVATFTDCYDVSGLGSHSGVINKTFVAPTAPGVYYITQVSSWEYNCYDNGFGQPGNDPNNAIAVLLVNLPDEKITASTNANENSLAGAYPIILQPCNTYNPNYEVVLQNGVLTVSVSAPRSIDVNVAQGSMLLDNPTAVDALSPNPATTVIRLSLSEDVVQISGLMVYDPSGKVIKVPIKKIGDSIYEISISQLPKGIYMINAITATRVKTFKFIKR